MKITILGCGPANGVPSLGNAWAGCDPTEPRNTRRRASILIEEGETMVLVDTSPDMRAQLMPYNIERFSAVLYTHAHADHCHGIDDLRYINWITKKPIPIYADPTTMGEIKRRFDYIFEAKKVSQFDSPSVISHEIDGPFEVGSLKVIPFVQDHGYCNSLGFRIGDFAYSTDAKSLDENAFACLQGVQNWVVDAAVLKPHPTHSHLAQTLQWIERVKPKRAWLTHMSGALDYATIAAAVPLGVEPAYDGLVIEC